VSIFFEMPHDPHRNSLIPGNDPRDWIPASNRVGFILVFTGLTILASWLSQFSKSIALEVLRDAFPLDNSASSNIQDFFDFFTGRGPSISPGRRAIEGSITGTISGVIIGFFQWITLRQYLRDSKWIVATTLAYALSGLTYFFQTSIPHFYFGPLLQGLLQWPVLRPHVRRAWTWIFVPSLALLLQALIPFLLGFTMAQLFEGWMIVVTQILNMVRPGIRMGLAGLVPAICLCGYRDKRSSI